MAQAADEKPTNTPEYGCFTNPYDDQAAEAKKAVKPADPAPEQE